MSTSNLYKVALAETYVANLREDKDFERQALVRIANSNGSAKEWVDDGEGYRGGSQGK